MENTFNILSPEDGSFRSQNFFPASSESSIAITGTPGRSHGMVRAVPIPCLPREKEGEGAKPFLSLPPRTTMHAKRKRG